MARRRQLTFQEKARAQGQFQRRNQQIDFSETQQQLQELFGHGDSVWGLPEGESDTQVRINNDLHPSLNQNDEEQTSSLFGFGGGGERSGLF